MSGFSVADGDVVGVREHFAAHKVVLLLLTACNMANISRSCVWWFSSTEFSFRLVQVSSLRCQ